MYTDDYSFFKLRRKVIEEFPILSVEGGNIAPNPFMIIDKVATRLHESFRAFFEQNNKLDDYTGPWGEVYKEYIGMLLKDCFGGTAVFDLDNILTDNMKKGDWLVQMDDCVALFECKAHGFAAELRSSGKLSVLDSFIEGRIAPALKQLLSTESRWPKIEAALNLPKGKQRIHKFVVLWDGFYFANVLSDFLPQNATLHALEVSGTLILSTLDLETLSFGNCSSKFGSIIDQWRDKIASRPTLWRFLRELPTYKPREDSMLNTVYKDFMYIRGW